ncbi:MAG TPA: S46 family peptidase, partial [Gemmataceae bacterium]|nr:S46 family peptidase [Gemmataceae bacterium]
DLQYPHYLAMLNRQEVLLTVYSGRSEENARRARELLFSVQNSRKAREGGLAGLLDPALMVKKKAYEARLREAVAKDSKLTDAAARPSPVPPRSKVDRDPKLKDAASAWDRVEQAQKVIAENAKTYNMLEGAQGFRCTLFSIARTLVRNGEEKDKPNSDRLREYRDSARESLELQLLSEEPLYDDLEQLRLADALTWLCQQMGYNSPVVQKVLAGKSPRDRAAELVKNTKIKTVEFRKKLYEGGKAAIDNSSDPMIGLVKMIDADARAVRKIVETQDEIKRQAYSQIAAAKFAVEGTSTYPDATFTLRLAFGTVKGYEEDGKPVPYQTTFAGLYQRSKEHHNQQPFDLPPRWVERKDKLDLNVPFNFVCTADIIGGNSGSPVINKNAEVVGLIFDGNIQSLVLDFIYTDVQARAVAVHSQGIIEALRKVYDVPALADELTGKKIQTGKN